MEQTAAAFEQALLRLDRMSAWQMIQVLTERLSPVKIIEELIARALERIGEGWARGDLSLSQVYMSGKMCEEIVDTLLPPGNQQRQNQPRMAITVLEDYHLLGKRIVYSIIRSSGFDLEDYGRTDVAGLLDRIRKDRIDLLFISVLMLPSALRIKEVTARVHGENLNTRVIVGGALFLFDGRLWREVGASAMGRTASDALRFLEQIIEGKP